MNRREFLAAGLAVCAPPAWGAPGRFEHGLLWQVAKEGVAPSQVLLNLRGTGGGEGSPLDARLLERARLRRTPVSQIEGVEEQIFTFDEFPMESQVALLRHSLAHGAELAELAARTSKPTWSATCSASGSCASASSPAIRRSRPIRRS